MGGLSSKVFHANMNNEELSERELVWYVLNWGRLRRFMDSKWLDSLWIAMYVRMSIETMELGLERRGE